MADYYKEVKSGESLDEEILHLSRFGGIFPINMDITPEESEEFIDYCYKNQDKFCIGSPVFTPRKGEDTPGCHCNSKDVLLFNYNYNDDSRCQDKKDYIWLVVPKCPDCGRWWITV